MKAKHGDKVKVYYTLMTDNEDVVETTAGTMPVELTIGSGEFIPKFEESIIGMESGESKTFTIPAADAYGERDEQKVFELSRQNTPPAFEPYIGQLVRISRPDGSSFIATVLDVHETGFIMDANHPLAGKDLTFKIDLVEILS
jgi:peptidylprolyl isomerase